MGPVSTSSPHLSQWALCQTWAVCGIKLKKGKELFRGVPNFTWIGRFFCLDYSELRPIEPSSSRMEGGWWKMVPDTSTHGGCPLKHFTGNSQLLASWRGCLWSLVALLQIWWTPAADARPAPRWRPRYHTCEFRQRQNWLAKAIHFNVKQTA